MLDIGGCPFTPVIPGLGHRWLPPAGWPRLGTTAELSS